MYQTGFCLPICDRIEEQLPRPPSLAYPEMKREAALPSVEMRRLLDEHEAILDAIQSGDEEQARAAMRDHLKNSLTRYRSMLRTLR